MKVNQMYEIINLSAKQAFGSEAVQVTDLRGLIAMGDTVLATNANKDVFTGSLCDQISGIVVSNRKYSPKSKGLKKDIYEWGAALEKVYIEPYEASENEAWKISSENDPVKFDLGNHNRPSVKVEIFSVRDTWKYTISIPDYQLQSAFTGESQMTAFIDGIYTELENAMAIAEENCANLTEANYIAEKIQAQDDGVEGIHAVNLLHEYNTLTNAGLTVAKCLSDAGFLKFAGKEIKRYIEKFPYMNKLFNTKGYARFTPKDRLKLHLLSDYAAANATYLEADTFNKELVALPGYEEVAFWQGLGTDGSFDSVSSINVTTSSGTTISKSGIIGFAFDVEALGILFDKLKQDAKYDPEHDLTKVWYKATKGYFNDMSEQAIVFYIEEV